MDSHIKDLLVEDWMSRQFEKLRKLLAELFQFDNADLDFGIYRIMNTKRKEISQFLEKDLFPQVKEILGQMDEERRHAIEKELLKLEKQLQDAGVDPNDSPKVKELRAQLQKMMDQSAVEEEVYSHLYTFFSRYYDEGDFISKRRYKEDVYAIPYNGEEVKLYWANYDQYYIKTSEYFRNYVFKLSSGKRVRFKVVQAETDRDNIKTTEAKKRRFMLHKSNPLFEENGELVIYFEFRPDDNNRKQEEINKEIAKSILEQTEGFEDWKKELRELRPTPKNKERTLFEKHLADFTARNTFDYFIHKDLGGFLRRELDFYIKNEVVHLDDIEDESAPRVEQYLAKVKAIRRIGHKIIDFLAQLENFQKKLWLKKKFIWETQYCITLDKIFSIEDKKKRDWIIERILKNQAQIEEWKKLYHVHEIKGDLLIPGWSEPLTIEFLNAHPHLAIDTCHFDEEFKLKLISSFDNLDEELDGLLVHGENFQALNLLLERYREQVKCIYIDPPYNTEKDRNEGKFIYKDGYNFSSWLTMMYTRNLLAYRFLKQSAAMYISIDDTMYTELFEILANIFGRINHVATVIWEKVHTRKNSARHFSVSHDYIPCFVKDKDMWDRMLIPRENNHAYKNPDNDPRGPWKPDPVYANNPYSADYTIIKPNGVVLRPPPGQYWRFSEKTWLDKVRTNAVIWGEGDTYPMVKRYLSDVQEGLVPITLFDRCFAGDNAFANAESDALFGSLRIFSYPKPTRLIERLCQTTVRPNIREIVLDYFAGSGTTAHAVINLNREDGGKRKYILVEVADYFDTVLLPRIKKVVYSRDWKEGKPKPDEKGSLNGVSHFLKYIRLESYEDTLNNLELKPTRIQLKLLDENQEFREDYILHYMLDIESRGSLLNVKNFEDPFNYEMEIATTTIGDTRRVKVDMVETFNYLLGLRVQTVDNIRGVHVITGENPQGEKVLILWRNTKDIDAEKLNEWFKKQGYNTRDQEFDIIYVNGDNYLENLCREDQTWKVKLIEEEFFKRMFETEDI